MCLVEGLARVLQSLRFEVGKNLEDKGWFLHSFCPPQVIHIRARNQNNPELEKVATSKLRFTVIGGKVSENLC